MTLDETGLRFLADVMAKNRDQIVESATDWVIGAAVDLQSRRPREETRRIVDRCITGYEASIIHGDPAPMNAFIEFVTSFRASSEFHVSTLLRGFLGLRRALEGLLRREASDFKVAFEVLAALDDAYYSAAFRTADLYEEKLVATIVTRRRELERELSDVTEKKTRELDEKMALIEGQRAMLAALSAPLLRVWKDVLVLPLIGQWGEDRAGEILERALSTIHKTRARVLLVDITGLSEVDSGVTRRLLQLLQAARLIGADSMLVGVRPAVAQALVNQSGDISDMGGVQTFSTLYDGLRAALGGARGRRSPA